MHLQRLAVGMRWAHAAAALLVLAVLLCGHLSWVWLLDAGGAGKEAAHATDKGEGEGGGGGCAGNGPLHGRVYLLGRLCKSVQTSNMSRAAPALSGFC